MSLAQLESKEAFVECLDVFGLSSVINGQTIMCLLSKDAMQYSLEEGGFATSGAITIRVLTSSLNTPPVANDPILVSGARYKINEIDSQPGALTTKFHATRR